MPLMSKKKLNGGGGGLRRIKGTPANPSAQTQKRAVQRRGKLQKRLREERRMKKGK